MIDVSTAGRKSPPVTRTSESRQWDNFLKSTARCLDRVDGISTSGLCIYTIPKISFLVFASPLDYQQTASLDLDLIYMCLISFPHFPLVRVRFAVVDAYRPSLLTKSFLFLGPLTYRREQGKREGVGGRCNNFWLKYLMLLSYYGFVLLD